MAGTHLWMLLGVTLVGLLILVFLRREQPALATLLSLALSAILLVTVLPEAGQLFRLFGDISGQAGVSRAYLQILLKAVAITYVAGFAADLARDAQEKAIAAGVELVGKVMVLTVAAPVLVAITQQLLALLR